MPASSRNAALKKSIRANGDNEPAAVIATAGQKPKAPPRAVQSAHRRRVHSQELHRGVHAARQPVRCNRLAEADLIDVVDQPRNHRHPSPEDSVPWRRINEDLAFGIEPKSA
jgi:hypothetical protein